MQIEKIIKTTIKENLEIIGATLLSIDEAEQLPKRLLIYNNWWWLRSTGHTQNFADFTHTYGWINSFGNYIDLSIGCVRPALVIEDLNSSNLKVGDCFIFGGKEFEIISESLAFCKGDIGFSCFCKDRESKHANIYDSSDIKKFVDKWFEEKVNN